MHPIALVEEPIRERLKDYGGMWDDYVKQREPFPWPEAPSLRDVVAAVCIKELRRLTPSDDHYFSLYGQVYERVFGVPFEPGLSMEDFQERAKKKRASEYLIS